MRKQVSLLSFYIAMSPEMPLAKWEEFSRICMTYNNILVYFLKQQIRNNISATTTCHVYHMSPPQIVAKVCIWNNFYPETNFSVGVKFFKLFAKYFVIFCLNYSIFCEYGAFSYQKVHILSLAEENPPKWKNKLCSYTW